jgi:hypothetical protein
MATPSPEIETPAVSGLMLSGLCELALGAASGWPYALAIADPERARALGIRSTARLRQWHLDLIMLGGLTVLAAIALPRPPRLVARTLGVGAWTNAMLFGPLVFWPDAKDNRVYRAAVAGSFVTTSTGFIGLAVEAARRRRAGRQ